MGHLISRAIRRFTQCSSQSTATARGEHSDSAASGGEQQQQQRRREDQQGGASSRPFVESIPVGQSIDSAEYASFEQNKENKSDRSKIGEPERNHQQQQQQQQQLRQGSAFNNNTNNNDDNNSVRLNGAAVTQVDGDQNKPEVEEAVIKIQALVRGHLTRKALKDAQQQSATPPHPNALGQSQFDEESLTRNPPSAVFLSTFPLNLNLNLAPAVDQYKASKHLSSKVHLESIAEDAETTQSAPTAATISHDQAQAQDELRQAGQDQARSRLSPLNSLEQNNSGEAVSPVPSEANASIDLNCDTPASASIDISDHNVKPTDRIASILHPKTATSPQIDIREALQDAVTTTSTMVDGPPLSPPSPSSGDSEQAAAIRIQSAFRGYKTRKHSPYRRRSPSGNASSTTAPASLSSDGPLSPSEVAATTNTTKRTILRQQDATDVDRDDECQTSPARPASGVGDEDEGIEEDGIGRVAQVPDGIGRRLSRQRQRDDEYDQDHDHDHDHNENGKNLTTAQSNNPDAPAIREAGSVEEMTATEASTVREIKPNEPPMEGNEPTSEPVSASTDNQHQHQHQREHKASGALESGLESVGSASQVNVATGVQSLASILNDTGLSAALDGVASSAAGLIGQSAGGLITRDTEGAGADRHGGQQRPSDGGLSIDTDSSNLGANFSLTDEYLSSQSAQILPAGALTIDEDKSVGVSESDELALEARRLVDELTAEDEQDYNIQNQDINNNNNNNNDVNPEAALEEVTNILEEQLEEALGGETQSESVAVTNEPEAWSAAGGLVSSAVGATAATLDEVEQQTIELESDDIERRDPRGQVSEERAKSPLITSERPSLIETPAAAAATTDATASDLLEGVRNDQAASEQHNLKVAGSTPDEEIISGRSSPALLSSNGASSSDDEAAGENEEDKNKQHQKQAGGPSGGGGSKNKKRNRNKKKGKK